MSFNKFIWENAHLGPWLIFNSKKTFPLTSFESLLNWLNKRNYSFVKNITTKIELPINFNIIFIRIIFPSNFTHFVGLYKICVHKFMARLMGYLYLSSLSLKKIITNKKMVSKKIQGMHVNKAMIRLSFLNQHTTSL